MRSLLLAISFTLFILLIRPIEPADVTAEQVKQWAKLLGEELYSTFREATKADEIEKMYRSLGEAETYDPRVELKKSKEAIEEYLKKRAKLAWMAKLSLEARQLLNISDAEVNDPGSPRFVRYMRAKAQSDEATIFAHDHSGDQNKQNATRNFNLTANANFYGIATSSAASAVHIPTPVYDRNPNVLLKVQWSDIDQVYRANRDETRDLAFQMFCSEAGFMRYFPAASWIWDNQEERLDLFDCRATEWYINGATMSKNVLIMLDLSGSMLGQRFEIAKQTIESVLETLSDNDFFNIMPFSKEPKFLDECSEEARLLQATMRNKKILRTKLNNLTTEGKTDYSQALVRAFSTLKNLPYRMLHWTTADRVAAGTDRVNISNFARHIQLADGQILAMPQEFVDAMSHSEDQTGGCNDVIMLITDGAPDYYKEVFEEFNANKTVRFFSFLIGEEATDFEQIRWMACTNRGFMVHVNNMADVQEKVQHYIKVLSRPIGKYSSLITENDAIWSGVYRERLYLPRAEKDETNATAVKDNATLTVGVVITGGKKRMRVKRLDSRSEMFVSTVSYPVVVDGEFMGVSAVNVPITELQQLAAHFKFGPLSYSFLLDNNGYVMFHPQLRAIDPITKQTKPNYNNMDILELEVPQNQQLIWAIMPELGSMSFKPIVCKEDIFDANCVRMQRWKLASAKAVRMGIEYNSDEMRSAMIRCDNGEVHEMNVLYATDDLDRVYRQTNRYYAECIDTALFTVGVAISKGDEKRFKRKTKIDYGKVQSSWFEGGSWRIHPQWRYCLVNDSDANISPEEAFTVYVHQMRAKGELPMFCQPRRDLVDRLLFDMEVTNQLTDYWLRNWNLDPKKKVHLVWFAAPSGLIQFVNKTIEDIVYTDPEWVDDNVTRTPLQQMQNMATYTHFVAEENKRTSQDTYYKRAVRMRDRIVINVNTKTRVWYREESKTAFGNMENVSLLMHAVQALYVNDAVVGVAGMEFLYDGLANTLKQFGCGPADDRTWCFLLDEHAYIVYSSLNRSHYSYVFSMDPAEKRDSFVGRWFGHVNRITERAMTLLYKNNFYTETTYVDYQAICKDEAVVLSAATILRPFIGALNLLIYLCHSVWRLLSEYTILGLISILIKPTEGYTASFHDPNEGLPCDKASHFYLANWGEENFGGAKLPMDASLVGADHSERPCKHNSAQCAVKMFASWVPKTNLLLIAISQSRAGACYRESECPMSATPEFHFGFTRVQNASDKQQTTSLHPTNPASDTPAMDQKCRHMRSKERKAPLKCLPTSAADDESDHLCSGVSIVTVNVILLFCAFWVRL